MTTQASVERVLDDADAMIRTMREIRALPEHQCDGHVSGRLHRRGDGSLWAEFVCDVCGEQRGVIFDGSDGD